MSKERKCENCFYYGRHPDAPETVEKGCTYDVDFDDGFDENGSAILEPPCEWGKVIQDRMKFHEKAVEFQKAGNSWEKSVALAKRFFGIPNVPGYDHVDRAEEDHEKWISEKHKYKPKIIEGKIKNTGWPIDGHTLILSLWDYDNYEDWHMSGFPDEAEAAVMETMYITETEAGMCLYDTLEEFAEHWKEWEPEGVFCIPLEHVEVVRVIQEEEKNDR